MDKKIKSVLDNFEFSYRKDYDTFFIISKSHDAITKHLSVSFGNLKKPCVINNVVDYLYYEGSNVKSLTEEELDLFLRAFDYLKYRNVEL